MKLTLTIQRLLDPRPDDPLPDALIFNAPGPLCGHMHWRGESRHGNYYVAINPSDRYAEGYIRETVRLGGWLCEYVSEDTVKTWAEEKAKEYECSIDDKPWGAWVQSWVGEHGRKEVDLGEFLGKLKRETTINAILKAARRPLPNIQEIVELECTDGQWRRPFGIPHGVQTTDNKRIAGYAFADHNGSTYGKREASREALIERHTNAQDAEMATFRSQLEQMSISKLESQANYWLSEKQSR